MASEIKVREVRSASGGQVTVGYGVSVDDGSTISIGSSINVIGNLTVDDIDVTDSMEVEFNLDSSLTGDGSNLTNMNPATDRSRVIAYNYIMDVLPLTASR